VAVANTVIRWHFSQKIYLTVNRTLTQLKFLEAIGSERGYEAVRTLPIGRAKAMQEEINAQDVCTKQRARAGCSLDGWGRERITSIIRKDQVSWM
jgi:hypothetical protein